MGASDAFHAEIRRDGYVLYRVSVRSLLSSLETIGAVIESAFLLNIDADVNHGQGPL
jgi:hypothetical protein